MPGTTNFLPFNPGAVNQENDATYAADALRNGGIPTDALFPSPLGNKMFFQWSQFIAAFAGMLADKNYSTSDANLANLKAVLANILTNVDLQITSHLNAASGYIKLPPALGGIMFQWIVGATDYTLDNNLTSQSLNFYTPFPNACLMASVQTQLPSAVATDIFWQLGPFTTTTVLVIKGGSHNDAGRHGYYLSGTTPLVLALGY